MAYSQITSDWNQRFIDNDTPWEDSMPSEEMQRLFQHFIHTESKVLEVGCSTGVNGICLAEMGYDYTGIDISQEAIKQARAISTSSNAKFEIVDFMKSDIEAKYDTIFDKGLFHTFQDKEFMQKFAEKVSDSIQGKGFWISILGNRDNPDSFEEIEKFGFPRITAKQIVDVVEDLFEIHYLARCMYGDKSGNANFLGWACVFQKR